MLAAELSISCAARGMTLCDALQELYQNVRLLLRRA
jgi:hypothetical protein